MSLLRVAQAITRAAVLATLLALGAWLLRLTIALHVIAWLAL